MKSPSRCDSRCPIGQPKAQHNFMMARDERVCLAMEGPDARPVAHSSRDRPDLRAEELKGMRARRVESDRSAGVREVR
jgi:hypothetical protein